MCPLQITVAPDTHKNSREQFFKAHGEWITDLSKFDVEVHFLWITPKYSGSKKHTARPKEWPEHRERHISFGEVNKKIGEAYEDAMRKLPKNEAAMSKPPKKTAAKEKPPKKTAAKGKPPKQTTAKGEPPQRRSARLQK